MPIEITCTNCAKTLRVPDAAAGKAAKCPGCGTVLKIPTIGPNPAAAPAPPQAAQPPAPQPNPTAPPPNLTPSSTPDQPAAAKAPTAPAKAPAPVSRAPATPARPAAPPQLELSDSKTVPASKRPAAPASPPAKASARSADPVLALPDEEVISEAHDEEVISEAHDEVISEAHDEEVISEAHDDEVIGEEAEEIVSEAHIDGAASALIKDNPFEGIEIPKEAEAEIRKQLTQGEKIVWVGRQSLRLLMSYAFFGSIAGGVILFFGLIALFGLSILLYSQFGVFPMLGGLCFGLFVCVLGAVLLCLPLIVKLTARFRPVYVLTTRNAHEFKPVSFSNWKQVTKTTWTALKVANMSREDSWRHKGAGSLIFETRQQVETTGSRGGAQVVTLKFGFMHIEQVQEVEELVRQTLVNRQIDRLVNG